jgi:hypothetical protein
VTPIVGYTSLFILNSFSQRSSKNVLLAEYHGTFHDPPYIKIPSFSTITKQVSSEEEINIINVCCSD